MADPETDRRFRNYLSVIYVKVPVYNPDLLLNRLLPYLRWIFTTWFLVLSGGVMMTAFLLIASHFETFCEKMPSNHEFFSFKTVAYLWVALVIVKCIHEFAHGLTCKAFGGEVREAGIMLLCLTPCLYANFSGVWKLPNKWHRVCVNCAGIYAEVVIASLATITWWNTPAQPFLNNLSFCLIVVCSVTTILFDACPLIHFDGFYILSDWLGNHESSDLDRLSLWTRFLSMTCAFARYVYSLALTLGFLWFLFTFLSPYKLTLLVALSPLILVLDFHRWLSIRTHTS